MKKKYLILVVLSILLVSACSSNDYEVEDDLTDPIPELVLFETFERKFINGDYYNLYSLLSPQSQDRISRDDFVTRHQNLVSGLFDEINWTINDSFFELLDYKFETAGSDDFDFTIDKIPFTATMYSIAGKTTRSDFEFNIYRDEDGEVWVDWQDSLIYPDLQRYDVVRVWDLRHDFSLRATRGSIFDLQGNALARDGYVRNIGLWPEHLTDEDVKVLANVLDVDVNLIINELENAVDPTHRIPFVNLLLDSPIRDDLRETGIIGLVGAYQSARIYIDHNAFGMLLGNVSAVTAEDLENDSERVYFDGGVIGRSGLEFDHEETLRGIHGMSIVILRDGAYEMTIARREPVNGSDITITIDSQLQIDIYESFNGRLGTAAATDPRTGEVLALVSSPSFNSNHASGTTHIPFSEIAYLNPERFANRLRTAFSPGSVFKLHTAAIGLELGIVNPTQVFEIEGRTLQLQEGINITRWTDDYTEIDLRTAVAISDNIYFAKKALDITGPAFVNGLNSFTVGSPLGIGLSLNASQFSNSGDLNDLNLLSETSFGQGQVLTTALNIALDYSILSNNGNIMDPFLVVTQGFIPAVMKENVVSSANLAILQDVFRAVIEEGTAQNGRVAGVDLVGKTGTAEVVQNADGSWMLNRWYVATDIDYGRISLAVMLEDVDDSASTADAVEIVQNVLARFFR